MERVSALRIELYEELQSLPEVLRSEYPDLAVDFLATVFREPPAHPASLTATDELLKGAAAPAFQLLPSPPDGGCSEDGALPAQLAAVQSMLEAAQQEAATIEATASTMPPDGWGDLEMSLQRAAPTPARQQQPGSHAASPAARPPAQLVQCKRCRKVLLACSSPEHQRQCMQQEQLADAGSLSDEPSSSEGVPAAAPSASRGSKRKGLGGAAASGGGAAKHSRPSLAGRRAAVSLEASPSLGEVAQGAPRQRHERRSAPPPIHIPAAPAAVKPASSAPPVSGNLEPLSPTIHLSSSQRRRRTQHPPRLRRRFLTIHPGRDLEQPLLLNAVATPAVPATFDPAAGAAAAAAALAGAPTVVPLPAPGGTQPVGSAHDLPGPAAAAAPAQATQPAVAVQHATGAGGGWGAEQQAMLQWAMQPQAAAAQQAAAPAALDPAPQPHVSDQQQVNQEPQSAVQQQAPPSAPPQQQQQQQAPAQQTAQPQAQQTQQAQQAQQQVKSQESCRIFQSLTPEQQKALREQLARRKAAQQAAAQQAQAAGAPAAHAHRPPGGASQPPRLAVLSPQQMQQLHQQNVAALQQQQAGRGVPPAGARPHAVFPPGFVMAQPAFHLTAGSAGAAGGLPGTLPMQLAHGASSGAMPSTAGQSLPGVFLALPAGQPMPGALPLVQQAFQMQQPSMPQQQQQQGGAAGPAAAVQGIAVGIPLPQASGAGMLGGATPAGCFPGMQTQLPLRPSLPVYPGLRPMAAAAGAPVLGMPGPAASAAAGLPAGMMPVGPFPGQQQAALVQQSGVARPSMQFVPAP